MDVADAIESLRQHLNAVRSQDRSIALVPTMGALHEGHLSLIRLAKASADYVVVSIYVNPTQFGVHEDFGVYPRPLEKDLGLCRDEAVDLVFTPDNLYRENSSVVVDETALSGMLCGESRPGHFSGVLTVVAKLFNLVQPDIAVFGEKDAQQLALISRMVQDLDFPIRILRGETVREADGLALSSRNRYLSVSERARAISLFDALESAARCFAEGERDAQRICDAVRSALRVSDDDSVDYIACVNDENWNRPDVVSAPARICIAVKIGGTRLIDNRRLES